MVKHGAKYGGDDENGGTGYYVCNFHSGDSPQSFFMIANYVLALFIVPLFFSITLMAFIILVMWRRFSYVSEHNSQAGRDIRQVISNVAIYPLGLFLFWIPMFVIFIIYTYFAQDRRQKLHNKTSLENIYLVTQLFYSFGSLYGLFMSFVFFRKSKEAREKWHTLLIGICGVKPNEQNNIISPTHRHTDFMEDEDPDPEDRTTSLSARKFIDSIFGSAAGQKSRSDSSDNPRSNNSSMTNPMRSSTVQLSVVSNVQNEEFT